MSFPFPAFVPAAQALQVFGSSGVDAVDRTTYTFTAGLASGATRHLVFVDCGAGGTARTVSALTLSGVAGTFLARAQDLGHDIEAWLVDGVSGASATLSVTWSAGRDRCGYSVYGLFGAASTPADTGTATAENPIDVDNIDVPANGCLIGAVICEGGSARTFNWSSEVTEDYDETLEADTTHSGAANNYTAAQTGLTITATPSGVPTRTAMIVLSFGPG